MKPLIRYLAARLTRQPGWIAEYELTLHPNDPEPKMTPNASFLAGHYHSLLNDVINAVGEERLLALLHAQSAIEKQTEGGGS